MTIVGEAFVNIVPDTTKFRAQLTAQLGSINTSALKIPVSFETTGAGASVNRTLNSVTSSARSAGAAAGKGFSNEFEKNMAASNEAVRKLLQEFRNLLVVVGAVSVIGRPFKQLTSAGVTAAAQLEQMKIAFTGILGSAGAAADAIQKFRTFAAQTPFQFTDVTDAAQRFLALGKTVDETLDILKTIGDAAAISGRGQESINRVTLAFTQISAAGRLLGQDLRQITDALPNIGRGRIFEQLAKDMGVSTQEVQKLQEQGLVPADVALKAILETMKSAPGAAGAMAKQMQTLTGLFSNFKDTVQASLATAFTPLADQLKVVLKDVTPIAQTQLTDIGQVLAQGIGDAVPSLIQSFADLAPVIIDVTEAFLSIVPALSGVTTVLAALEPALNAIAAVLNAIPTPVLQFVGVVFTLRAAMGGLNNVLGGFATKMFQVAAATQGLSALEGTATATAGLRISVAGLASSFSNLISPQTAIIAGAGALLVAWTNSKRAAEEHKREVQALTQAYLDNASAATVDAQTALQNTLGKRNQIDDLRKLGLSFQDFVGLTQTGAQGFLQFINVLERGGQINEHFAESLRNSIKNGTDFDTAMRHAIVTAGAFSGTNRGLIDTFIDQAKTEQDAAKNAIDTAIGLGKVTEAQVKAAEAAHKNTDGTIDFLGAMNQLGLQMSATESAASDLASGMVDLGDGSKYATKSFEDFDNALKGVEDAFKRSIGAALDVADANDALADSQNKIADLQQKLNDELHGTAEERDALARANEDLTKSEQDLRDAQGKANETALDLLAATADLNEARATEGARAARQLRDAERELADSKRDLADMEQKLLDLEKERQKANDPRKLRELAQLERLRASVGAAPPSFIDDLESRIEQLKQTVGPEATARINREMEATRDDIAAQKDKITDATDKVTEAQAKQKTGTDELKEAEDKAAKAADAHREALDGVQKASRDVTDRQKDVQKAYHDLQPDLTKVHDLQRDIERAQRDSIRAAFDLATAITQSSGTSADNVKNTLGKAFDDILAKFPAIKAELDKLPRIFTLDFELNINPGESIKEVNVHVNPGVTVRAAGGLLGQDQVSWVGENGPELFIKHAAGRVLSSKESIAAVAQGIREAIEASLQKLPSKIGTGSDLPPISVVAPTTDSRDIVDGVTRALRAGQHLWSIS
jgi:tape measure domain-containing protein